MSRPGGHLRRFPQQRRVPPDQSLDLAAHVRDRAVASQRVEVTCFNLRAGVGVAGGFCHLLAIGQQVLCMNPIIDKLLAGIAFTLGKVDIFVSP